MAKLSARAFADFLVERARAKDGYIMGATGQDPKTLSQWWFNQYSGSQYSRAIYWKNHAQRVWDCNGLAEGYYRDMTGESINTRARYNYSGWCSAKGAGLIPPDMRAPGAAVFWGASAKDIAHVAFLIAPADAAKPEGDWRMIEARGVNYGVVETRLFKRNPNFWGRMDKYFVYDTQARAALIVTGDSVNIREGPGVSYSSAGMVGKGYALTPVLADGWTPVEYLGGVKWISSKYVKEGTA